MTAGLCTDHVHYVESQGKELKAGLFLTIIFWQLANLLILCRFPDIVCGFLFLVNDFPPRSLEYATYSISCIWLIRIGTTEEELNYFC